MCSGSNTSRLPIAGAVVLRAPSVTLLPWLSTPFNVLSCGFNHGCDRATIAHKR